MTSRVRRYPVVGQAVPGGQDRHLERRREEAHELGQERRPRGVARDVQQLRGAGPAGELGEMTRVQALDRRGDQGAGGARAPASRPEGRAPDQPREDPGRAEGMTGRVRSVRVIDEMEGLQEMEQLVVVARRHRRLARDPGEQVLIALLEQRLVAVELGAVEPGEVPVGEPAQQQIAFQAAAISALIRSAACGGSQSARSCALRKPRGIADRSMAKHVADPGRIAKAGGDRSRGPPSAGAVAGSDAALAALFAPARGLKGVGPYLDGALIRLFGLPDGVGARRLDLLFHLPQGVIDRAVAADRAVAEGERVTLTVRVEQHHPSRPLPPRPRSPTASAVRARPEGCIWCSFTPARPGCARPCRRAASGW